MLASLQCDPYLNQRYAQTLGTWAESMSTPQTEESRYAMGNSQVRLLEGQLSDGLETCTSLVRCSEFSAELGKRIRQPGGAERAVRAMLREFQLVGPPTESLKSKRRLSGPVATKPLGEDNGLPADHYRVRVTYAPMPSMDELKKEWGEDNVSTIVDDGRPFMLHASCVNMDRTPGEKVFYVHDAGRCWESKEQIARGAKRRNAAAPNGYRPATYEETYEFAKAHPWLADFVGLGSFVVVGADRYVARVWRNDLVGRVWKYDAQRILGHGPFDGSWHPRSRVLFVSK